MGKGLDFLKETMKVIGAGLSEGAKLAEERHQREQEEKLDLKPEVTLDAEKLRNLRGMSSYQLESIFRNKVVHLADDPAVYRELKGFSSYQLEAIFGKEEEGE